MKKMMVNKREMERTYRGASDPDTVKVRSEEDTKTVKWDGKLG